MQRRFVSLGKGAIQMQILLLLLFNDRAATPPFTRKLFVSDHAYACEVILRIRKTLAENCVLYMYALLVNIATGG